MLKSECTAPLSVGWQLTNPKARAAGPARQAASRLPCLAYIGLFAILAIFCANSVRAQEAPSSPPSLKRPADVSSDKPKNDRPPRWLEMNAVSLSMRYRNYDDSDGFKLFDFGQQKSLIDGRFKLDSAGKYSVNFVVSSGRYFGWSYADVIGGSYGEVLGTSTEHYVPFRAAEVADAVAVNPAQSDFILHRMGSNGWSMGLRRFYFSAAPIKQLTFEYGSLAIERGASSEITTYDEDGYIAGERLRIRDPRHLYLDELTVTYGYLGDFFTPNFFSRGERLAQSNYHQFMAMKSFGKRLKASVDYTWDKGTHTMREAVLASVPEVRFVDSVRLELYQRTNGATFEDFDFDPGKGVAVTFGKHLRKALLIEGGYDYIDHDYTVYAGSQVLDAVNISLNGDAYGTGRRMFARASYKVNPYVSFFGFYTHAFDTFWNSGQEGFNAGLTIDFKKVVNDRLK